MNVSYVDDQYKCYGLGVRVTRAVLGGQPLGGGCGGGGDIGVEEIWIRQG